MSSCPACGACEFLRTDVKTVYSNRVVVTAIRCRECGYKEPCYYVTPIKRSRKRTKKPKKDNTNVATSVNRWWENY